MSNPMEITNIKKQNVKRTIMTDRATVITIEKCIENNNNNNMKSMTPHNNIEMPSNARCSTDKHCRPANKKVLIGIQQHQHQHQRQQLQLQQGVASQEYGNEGTKRKYGTTTSTCFDDNKNTP